MEYSERAPREISQQEFLEGTMIMTEEGLMP
jgi:hypothetical protein